VIGKKYYIWLSLLLALFIFRVVSQFIQSDSQLELSYLPKFDEWQGSTLSYPILLVAQIFVIICLIVVIARVRKDNFKPAVWKYRSCLILGSIYFLVMTFRLMGGQTILSEYQWFAKPIPAFFHIILASFILIFGWYLRALYFRQCRKT